jgi:serine/threonine protein kinase/tetratricopeptide (TPR) repeat protein
MATSPENWDRIKELFDAALERDSEQRFTYLRENAPDPSVRYEVERLLAEHDQAGSFLSGPAYEGLQLQPKQFEHRFLAGEMLAGRFRIVRFIAAGGMGEVYEAQDLELQESLAIKTIKPEVLQQSNALERFKREVHLARKVTHLNVCRVFDLFRCKSEASESGEVVFVSMELLEGESLSERIRRAGCFDAQEALPLIAQLCAGLAAAHHAGVVHRDFKPGNVVLVPNGTSGQIRAAITDFGLAFRSGGDASLTADLTTAYGIFGTPAYMAPEQIEGHEVTSRADIYALGLVIHEMMTGALPFASETPLSMLARRLHEPTPSPRSLMPSLDTAWESAILRCLEREPSDRFGTAEEVVRALGGEIQSAFLRHAATFKPKILVPSFAALLALGVGLGFYVSRHRNSTANGQAQSGSVIVPVMTPRPTVAVLGFKNLSGRHEEDYLSNSLAETIDCELAAGEKVRTIPGENIARMKNDLSLPDAESYAADTLQKIRKNLYTDYVIEGSYLALGKEAGGQVQLNVRLQDTRTGETIASVAETGAESNLNELFAKAGTDLRMKLGVESATAQEEAAVRASLPTNPDAARYYAEGLDKYRKFDFLGSRTLLERTVAREPEFALGHLALAATWSQLFYDAKAKQEIRTAFELSKNLSRENRFNIEARYREANGERDRAVEIYKSLFTFFPDNIDYGLRLANTQAAAGKPKDALVTIDSLRSLPPPQRDDPRIDLAEDRAAYASSDFKRSELSAERAGQKALQAGAVDLFARSRSDQGSSLRHLGDIKGAILAFDEAKRFYIKSGNRSMLSRTLISSALAYTDEGELDKAKTQLNEALSIAQEIGDTRGIASGANNLGEILQIQGDLEGARTRYERALKSFYEIGEKNGAAMVLNNLGYVLTYQGDLLGAGKKYQESLALAREIGDRHSIQFTLNNLASIRFNMGSLQEADAAYVESLDLARQIGNKSGVGYDLGGRAEVLTAKGDLAGARKLLGEGMNVAQEIGEKRLVAGIQVDLGTISTEEGRPVDVEVPVKNAIKEYVSEKAVDGEATASAVLARSFLAQNKIPEAIKSIEQAEAAVKKSHDRVNSLDVAIVAARVNASSGRSAEAVSSLNHILSDAANMRCLVCQFDAHLALGEIEIRTGKSISGRPRLASLEKDATAKGFLLIARKAHALQQ